MQQAIKIFLLLAAYGLGQAHAHEDIRVIGTVIEHQDSHIVVQSRDGKTATIRLDGQTSISRDGAAVELGVLTAGNSVVVDAYGDGPEDLLALEIRIVPPIAQR